jgi:hypothetical protein
LCFERGDWHGAYKWAKGWIGSGAGEQSLEPWLVYVASAIKQSQRRTAVHAVDLALENWIAEAAPRGVLLYVRGEVIRRHLRDPKTALGDLRQAGKDVAILASSRGDRGTHNLRGGSAVEPQAEAIC